MGVKKKVAKKRGKVIENRDQISQIQEIVGQLEEMVDKQYLQIYQGLGEDFQNSKSQLSMEEQQMTLDEYLSNGKTMNDLPVTIHQIDQIINNKRASNQENINTNQVEEKQTQCTEQMLRGIQSPKSNRRLSHTQITPSKIQQEDCSNEKDIKISGESSSQKFVDFQLKNERGSVVAVCKIRENMSSGEKKAIHEQFQEVINGRQKDR